MKVKFRMKYGLQVFKFTRQKRYPKYKIYMKKAPYFSTVVPIDTNALNELSPDSRYEKYLTYSEIINIKDKGGDYPIGQTHTISQSLQRLVFQSYFPENSDFYF